MKTIVFLLTCSLFGSIAGAADFNITPKGDFTAWIVNTTNNPTLTLTRGQTYTFTITSSSSIHPFSIKTASVTSTASRYTDGVSLNPIPGNGSMTFVVPTNAPSTLFYNCEVHTGMKGTLNIINPAAPTVVKVLSLLLSPNAVTMKSLGTNTWSFVPEYSSNLVSSNWTRVPTFTNNFANGTNTTTFGRLEPICGSNVYLRMKQTFP